MTSNAKPNPSMDDYLNDGWVPIAETSLGITLEKSASSVSFGVVIGGTLIAIWGIFATTIPFGLSIGIAFLGVVILGVYDNTRPPLRMLILHEKPPANDNETPTPNS